MSRSDLTVTIAGRAQPTDDELAAIVAALGEVFATQSQAEADNGRSAWRFSGRRWIEAPVRRSRPYR